MQIYIAEKITDETDENISQSFFTAKSTNLSKKNPSKKERRSIYRIAARKAITEPETRKAIKENVEQSKSKTKSKTNNNSAKPKINQNKMMMMTPCVVFATCGSQRSYRSESPLYLLNGPNMIIGFILNFAVMTPSFAGQINVTVHVMVYPANKKKLKNNDTDIHLLV
ncbi:unnamed protein product [Mytilus coruscus]|uniref:Uncharacterized protein n=1 Tax=Mytilus coruscus TaxID=42192 RepID=A0A6J8AWF3_MYTCO|nr:unnamed protein product [Mytilus coruscus]